MTGDDVAKRAVHRISDPSAQTPSRGNTALLLQCGSPGYEEFKNCRHCATSAFRQERHQNAPQRAQKCANSKSGAKGLNVINDDDRMHFNTNTKETVMAENVYKVIELIGTSTESWEKAATAAVTRASKTLRDLRVAEVCELDLQLKNGKVEAYRAKVKVSFKYEKE